MTASTIAGLLAWQALDSRGKPTVGCEIRLEDGTLGQAIVPSGASAGRHEVVELRDGNAAYGGNGVRRAVEGLRAMVEPAITGLDAADQAALDRRLRELDGTPKLERLGGNAILAVSVAAAVATARRRPSPEQPERPALTRQAAEP